MRREIRARWLAALTAILVVVLAALFAAMRNAHGAVPTGAVATAPVQAADYISLQTVRTTAMQRG